MKDLADYYKFYDDDRELVILKRNKKVPVKKSNNSYGILASYTFIHCKGKSIVGKSFYITIHKYMTPITEDEAMLELL